MNATMKAGTGIALAGASLNVLADFGGHVASPIKLVGVAMLIIGAGIALNAGSRNRG